ncbi:MerR family transcriptional regulator [Amycolatopsis magusensis]|uniref:MerR family transcriptional regulator n=1 Tax=Amycolatopsis magusensis TaxID=882444 RepID=UPI0037ACD6E2
MRIGDLSRRTGVSVRALRYYEEEHLLRPGRDGNGYRCFQESDVAKVVQIQLFYSAGLCSSKIAQLLPCVEGTAEYIVPGPGLAKDLEVARQRIRGQISQLETSLGILERVLAASNGSADRCVPVTRGPRGAVDLNIG